MGGGTTMSLCLCGMDTTLEQLGWGRVMPPYHQEQDACDATLAFSQYRTWLVLWVVCTAFNSG